MAAVKPYDGPRSLSAASYDLVTAADARLAGDLAVYADPISRGTTGRGSSSARRP